MSNDVHLARVSKIQRSSDVPAKGNRNRRCIYGLSKCEQVDEARTTYEEIGGSSISPRGGVVLQVSSDLESPDLTQRDTTESDNNVSSCSTLDIVNKMENLSVQHLETKIRDLSQRLQQATEQRMATEHLLHESNAEKELCLKRLEIVSAAHECRITEMHCVIAELSKKLRNKQENTIVEEQEPEGSEVSFQEGSVYDSEMNLTNPDAECQTDPVEEADADGDHDLCHEDPKLLDNINKGQLEALQEEVFHLKAQIALLQSEIANPHSPLVGKAIEEPQTIEYHQPRIEVMLSSESIVPATITHKHKQNVDGEMKVEEEEEQENNELHNTSTLTAEDTYVTSPHKQPAIPKMAERVRLKCASKHEADNYPTTKIRESELKNSNIVDQLLEDLKLNTHSIMESFAEPSQLDTELNRLQRKVEHLKAQNAVLSLTLDESKEHCERLYLLCGKYESNAIALQVALNCSDRAIEAYDVMLALLESKLALIKEKSIGAEESRKAVESVARHLLNRLESEKNLCENSLGPWQNSFNIPDKPSPMPWTVEDDNRLRYHVSKLKGRRTTVQNTLVQLESPFSDTYEESRTENKTEMSKVQTEKNTRLDLEMAILMQELLNLREENLAIKLKAEHAEREKQYANDRISVLHEALKQLQMQLQLNSESTELFHRQQLQHQMLQQHTHNSEAEQAAATEQQLIEALTRESKLKTRIQTLIASVTETQKMSDDKYEHLHNNVKELQKSNQSLTHVIEQTKRKYQTRIRKLEQKIMNMGLEVGRQQQNELCHQPAPDAPDDDVGFVFGCKCNAYKTNQTNASLTPLKTHGNVPETTL